jgi:hypothetical protein
VPGRGETRRPCDVLPAAKAFLEARLALKALGAYAIAALAQRPRSLPHHGRAHERLLAPGVSRQPPIRAPRRLSSSLKARARALALQAVANIA